MNTPAKAHDTVTFPTHYGENIPFSDWKHYTGRVIAVEQGRYGNEYLIVEGYERLVPADRVSVVRRAEEIAA